MRALVMSGPADSDPFEVREVADVLPGPGEVTVDVEYAGINFADVLVGRGDHAYGAGWPYVPGLEVVGTLAALGPGVSGLEVGQRVTAYTYGGGFAEVAVAAASLVVPLPGNVDSAQATAVPVTLSTAHLLLSDAVRMRHGDRVLVHSASGGMGIAIGWLARRYGPELLVGTVSAADKVSMVEAQGYDGAIIREDGWDDIARDLARGRGYNVILSALGTDLLTEDIALTAPGGKVLRYGNAPGHPHSALPELSVLNQRNIAVGGFSRRALAKADPTRVAEALRESVEFLADGLHLPVTVSKGLEAVPSVMAAMRIGQTVGKQVVRL